jgi:hypothetical protein
MSEKRVEALIKKLERGLSKSNQVFEALEAENWDGLVTSEPDTWTVKQLVWHFISAEGALFTIAKDIASGGPGATESYDIDRFNQEEMDRLPDLTPGNFIKLLGDTRKNTIEWLKALDSASLDNSGDHPVLGPTTVEGVIYSIYAHQLMHMREMIPQLKARGGGS